MKNVEIKPLEWTERAPGWYGKTALGEEYFAGAAGFWALCHTPYSDMAHGVATDLESAKAECEAHWRQRVMECLVIHEPVKWL